MLKEPRPGRVKTRLGRDIGMTAAAWWFRHQTGALLRRLQDPRWDVILAVSPDREGLSSRVWPAHLPRMPQGQGDLGDRMRRVFAQSGGRSTCIIGADIPGIRRHHVARAFEALGAKDAVIGPAPDGGYWLVGLKHAAPVPPRLFRAVRWSGPDARADTIASLPDHRIAFVDTLRDIDIADDLAMTFIAARATSGL